MYLYQKSENPKSQGGRNGTGFIKARKTDSQETITQFWSKVSLKILKCHINNWTKQETTVLYLSKLIIYAQKWSPTSLTLDQM